MNADLYPQIFKRQSFHLFRGVGDEKLTQDELDDIIRVWPTFESLYPDIKTKLRIVPGSKFALKRDAEYCVLIYSEKKANWLMNAGYLGEQLDLYLVSKNIGTLWYGIGRPDEETFEGLDYVIMFAIRKVSDASLYRKDMFKATRKELDEIWTGDTLGVAEVARFAPSACNSQPWAVKNEDGILSVTRYKKQSRIGIMSPKMAFYFNRIDIGIFLCILEICMAHNGIRAKRELFTDDADNEYNPCAKYTLEKK